MASGDIITIPEKVTAEGSVLPKIVKQKKDRDKFYSPRYNPEKLD